MATRWSLLEVDDGLPIEVVRERERRAEQAAREEEARAHAEREHAARELREAPERERRAAALRHEAEMERLAAERLEAGARRSQLRAEARSRKAEGARARRKVGSAKEQVNNAIEKIIGKNYLRDKLGTEDAIFDACREAGYEVGELANTTEHAGNVRETYPLHLEGGETHYLHISTYPFEHTGTWEFVAYVS
jgi:hypothetical protein